MILDIVELELADETSTIRAETKSTSPRVPASKFVESELSMRIERVDDPEQLHAAHFKTMSADLITMTAEWS